MIVMKKALCIIVCLCLLVPCAFAEETLRVIEENDADYAWLYENALTVSERFQYGLDCTWHSFLLSAANVPEQDMLTALSPLRMQDYNQPSGITFVRADQLLPDEMIEAWQTALKAEDEDKAARAALRTAELVNELAIVKLANAEEEAVELTEEAAKTAEAASVAAKESAQLAKEAAETALTSGGEAAAKAAEETALTAKKIAQLAEKASKAAAEAAKAVKGSDKGEAFLAAKEAKKAAEKASKAVKNAKNAAEETALRIEDTVKAAENAAKAAKALFKAEENAIQAAQILADLNAAKAAEDTEDSFVSESAEDQDAGGVADTFYYIFDFDFDADTDAAADGSSETNWTNWDLDWDGWISESDAGTAATDAQEKNRDDWFMNDDPERDLYHSAPTVLNFQEKDKMFSTISTATRVTGIYTRDDALGGPCYAVAYYGGLYALLITWYPAGNSSISVNAQVIYSRSADELIKP